MKTVMLYRPVGLKELELIMDAGFRAFPPRLEWQPIFYPVLNEDYAAQIALQWNTQDEFSGFCGIVTQFALKEAHYSKYEVQNVGGVEHNELWIPAEELQAFNEQIAEEIKVIKVFFGEQFVMPEHPQLATLLSNFKSDEIHQ
jgi:hypothetical protein